MTFREKLKMEHPDKVVEGACGGCIGCPYDYGYEQIDGERACGNPSEALDSSCRMCWDREIPGTEAHKDPAGDKRTMGECGLKEICKNANAIPDLNALIERAATKKDISLSIFIREGDTHISIYPCPDPSEKKGNPVAEAYKLLVGSPHSAEAFENAIKKLEEALE